jgi:hypothetical protein
MDIGDGKEPAKLRRSVRVAMIPDGISSKNSRG